jgi:hypothetical protein
MPAFLCWAEATNIRAQSHYNKDVLRRVLIFVLLLLAVSAAADVRKRLFLKDGTYQVIQKYEVQGDRVRYLSAERRAWEEVPSNMVDWDATHKYEAEHAETEQPAVEKIPTKEEMAKQMEEAMTPEVAPNLRLPKTGGVFAVDSENSQPRLVELTQNSGDINQHVGKNILIRKVIKVAPTTETIELPGQHSKIQLHTSRPTVYLNVDTDPEEEDASVARKRYKSRPSSDAYRYKFVKLEQKSNVRIIGSVKNFSVSEDSLANQTVLSTYGRIMDGDVWVKIEPNQELAPGEYAIAEMLTGQQINRFVWDFSIAGTPPKERKK